VAKTSEETNSHATYIYHFMFLASVPSIFDCYKKQGHSVLE